MSPMDEADDFALVPRPPGALEKAEPDGKRILSGMVSDTLALARNDSSLRTRPLRIVTMDDEPFMGEAMKMMLRFDLPNAEILNFTDAEAALEELEREAPDLFTTDWHHPGMLNGDGLLRILASWVVKYPIFVISASAESLEASGMVKEYADRGLNVTLLSKPFLLHDLRRLMSAHLGSEYGRI